MTDALRLRVWRFFQTRLKTNFVPTRPRWRKSAAAGLHDDPAALELQGGDDGSVGALASGKGAVITAMVRTTPWPLATDDKVAAEHRRTDPGRKLPVRSASTGRRRWRGRARVWRPCRRSREGCAGPQPKPVELDISRASSRRHCPVESRPRGLGRPRRRSPPAGKHRRAGDVGNAIKPGRPLGVREAPPSQTAAPLAARQRSACRLEKPASTCLLSSRGAAVARGKGRHRPLEIHFQFCRQRHHRRPDDGRCARPPALRQ